MSNGDLMTTKDAAERAGISSSTLLTMVNAGYIKKYKIGMHGFVHYRDVLRGSWQFEQDKKYHGVANAGSKAEQ